jgi:hypothetical protein
MLLKVLQRFALSHVIRIFLQVTEPELAILPVNVTKTFHAIKVPLSFGLSNVILSVEGCRSANRRHWPTAWHGGVIAGFAAG